MTRSEILKIAKPILFNTEMVRAIMGGRKTVTRRPVKMKYGNTHIEWHSDKYGRTLVELQNDVEGETYGVSEDGRTWQRVLFMREIRPPYSISDYLYVRETFAETCDCCGITGISCDECHCGRKYLYRASPDDFFDPIWKPSIHMPKEAARIFLRVTNVQVERLQDITNDEAIREGFTEFPTEPAIVGFVEEWDNTIKKSDLDKYGVDANPWVWVIEFERVEVA